MNEHNIFESFGERYQNIMLFYPIFQLGQSTHPKYKKINLMELGFGTLIFMLEEMLSNKRKITPTILAIFLKRTVEQMYGLTLSQEEANDLRKFLVDTKLRNEGKKFSYPYKDYQTGERKEYLIDLIEYENYSLKNIKENEIYLKLAPAAIELLFKTKEMYAELQISITMLYFKQQLKKGSFSSALQTVIELQLQIEQQIIVMENKIVKIKSNTLSEFNHEQLSKDLEQSKERTEREKEELEDLKEQVRQVRSNYQLMRLNKNEVKKLNQIEEIDKHLRKCMIRHEALFIKKQDLLGTIKTSLELLIENMFSKAFHFEREIIDGWIEKRIDQNILTVALRPISPIRNKKFYNPMECFLPQKLRKKSESIDEEIMELDEESKLLMLEEEQREKEEKERLNTRLISVIFRPMIKQETYLLSDAINALKNSDFAFYQDIQERYVDDLIFLCIDLHQENYKKFESLSSEQTVFAADTVRLLVHLTNQMTELEDIGGFRIESTKKILEFPNGTRMTDFILTRNGEME